MMMSVEVKLHALIEDNLLNYSWLRAYDVTSAPIPAEPGVGVVRWP